MKKQHNWNNKYDIFFTFSSWKLAINRWVFGDSVLCNFTAAVSTDSDLSHTLLWKFLKIPPGRERNQTYWMSGPMEEGLRQFPGKGTRSHAHAHGTLCLIAHFPASDNMSRSRYALLHMCETVNTHSLWSHTLISLASSK
jgi:hypothetical protein